jgi:hydroxymethylglutaryl-CoA reductase
MTNNSSSSMQPVKGFSKWSKDAKIEWVANEFTQNPTKTIELLKSYFHSDAQTQQLHDEFIENTLSNYFLPFAVAPNFLINNKPYCVPLAIEESSVVAAAAKAAGYWQKRGGFKTNIISTTKIGQVHFIWNGLNKNDFFSFFESIKHLFIEETDPITKNMRQRGGGINDIFLVDKTHLEPGYYQLHVTFETCDSMGANFINTVLEELAKILVREIQQSSLPISEQEISIIMSILSNYTPDCLVRAEVSCPIQQLNEDDMDPQQFAEKFYRAVRIAEIEPYRAATHNKGIMNGIDSVVIATGNDFRAIEACAHTYASRNGQYTSLTHCTINDDLFSFYIEIPLSLGTVGGITSLHPLVKLAHEILSYPNAQELMQITAAVGLAQNFSALRSLTTTGIQKGHMKMHLLNILNQLEATDHEKMLIVEYFKDKVVSHSAAVDIFCQLRGISHPQWAEDKLRS